MAGPRRLKARPICAVCRCPVEEFTEEPHETGALRGSVTFVARCHGEVERQRIDRRDVPGLNFGVAFVRADRLPAPAVRGLLGPGGA